MPRPDLLLARGAESRRRRPVRRGQQLTLALPEKPKRGGRRPGAGRPRKVPLPSGKRGVVHATRPFLEASFPVHVTLRALRGVPAFRSELVHRVAKGVFAELSGGHERGGEDADASREHEVASRPPRRWKRRRRATDRLAAGFRVVHYSLQDDHIHLIVEASDRAALSAGMRRLVIRLAKRIDVVARGGRRGKVWADRYHRQDLTSPRQVRNALVYVLQNGHKHGRLTSGTLDTYSTAETFAGWSGRLPRPRAPDDVATKPSSWLLRVGWLRAGGKLRVTERPRPARRRAPRTA